jgi:hypothetical protein
MPRSRLPWIAVALVLLFVALPLFLHFTQKRHNRLVFDIEQRYPESRPLAGGEVFAGALDAVVQHELDGYTGWRPNDFLLWGPQVFADNNANRQLGIIQGVRESLRVFKDHLTKVSSDEYDRNLIAADNAFRNDMEKFWLPSAESKLEEGAKHLRSYVRGLEASPQRSRPLVHRNVELIRLFQTWTDLLGDAHGSLYRTDLGFLETDDAFYHAQGVAHALRFLVQAVEREYRSVVAGRQVLQTLMREVADALERAAVLKPVAVFDGRPDGFLANHRRNLDAYITEARQKMYSIREELEK